jgi:3-hydroxy-3-methylglutaryl CoA synthase
LDAAAVDREAARSILWLNPMFELAQLPDPDGATSLLASIDLIVPHQAHKTMVVQLAERAGLSADQLYDDIETVGNASAASIPLAIHHAVRDGVISQPLRVFAPGFGAGAVAGYAVMRIDPSVVAVSAPPNPSVQTNSSAPQTVEDAPVFEASGTRSPGRTVNRAPRAKWVHLTTATGFARLDTAG